MTLQVLVSTMNQVDHSLLEKMNIQSDAIIVNQCDNNHIEEFDFSGHHILWMSLKERGVGLSRNTALMHSTADIILFADDDVVYEDNYSSIVIGEFEKNAKASLITFNLYSQNKDRPEYIVKENENLTFHNCLKYGACRIAVKRSAILYNTITFSLLFGGGAVHSAGEDNLFIVHCLKRKMKGIASKEVIGTVQQDLSTWFKGYDEKYYYDRGILMFSMYGWLSYIFIRILNRRNRINETLPKKTRNEKSLEGMKYCIHMMKYGEIK